MRSRGYFNFNTLGPRQNGRHFAGDMFNCIFLNENIWIPIEISLKFVPKGSINNNPALFQIMAWRRPGDKPLSEPMMVSSLTHICLTRPQWVKMPSYLNKKPNHKDNMTILSLYSEYLYLDRRSLYVLNFMLFNKMQDSVVPLSCGPI